MLLESPPRHVKYSCPAHPPGTGHEYRAEPDGLAGKPESGAVVRRRLADSDAGQLISLGFTHV